jgi:quercetin dioxygenase-like cupin family protein
MSSARFFKRYVRFSLAISVLLKLDTRRRTCTFQFHNTALYYERSCDMQVVSTPELELNEGWLPSDAERYRVRVNFPINAATGTEGSAVVYFELEPSKSLAIHTDSAEETLYIVSGTARAHLGDETGYVKAGDLVVIPALVPHGLDNIGDDTVRVVGFFNAREIESVFGEEMQPMGTAVFQQHEATAAALAA